MQIRSFEGSHQITLRSSKEGVLPLEIILDNAELADLIRCLDDLVADPKVKIDWDIPKQRPLPRRETRVKRPLLQRYSAPLFGLLTFFTCSLFYLSIPVSNPPNSSTEQEITK